MFFKISNLTKGCHATSGFRIAKELKSLTSIVTRLPSAKGHNPSMNSCLQWVTRERRKRRQNPLGSTWEFSKAKQLLRGLLFKKVSWARLECNWLRTRWTAAKKSRRSSSVGGTSGGVFGSLVSPPEWVCERQQFCLSMPFSGMDVVLCTLILRALLKLTRLLSSWTNQTNMTKMIKHGFRPAAGTRESKLFFCLLFSTHHLHGSLSFLWLSAKEICLPTRDKWRGKQLLICFLFEEQKTCERNKKL